MDIHWRPYQLDCKRLIKTKYDQGITKQLIVQATGTGKRMQAVNLAKHFKRTLFVAHREELIMQAYEEIDQYWPFNVGIIKGTLFELDKKIVVASVQTLRNRLEKIDPKTFDLLIIDEIHHYVSPTYLKCVRHFEPKLMTGWTATPKRLDGLSLTNIVQEIVFQYKIEDGIRDKWLAPLEAYQIKTQSDLSQVKRVAGDFNQKQLSEVIDSELRNNLIATKYLEYAKNTQAIAYCVDIDHAYNLRRVFREHGINCDTIVSDTNRCLNRSELVAQFKKGKIDVLTNVNILTEGFDYSDIGCIDIETEILTTKGWKGIGDDFNSVISYNIKSGNLEDTPVLARTDFNWTKGMVNIKGGTYDLKVTTNHRMLIGKGRRSTKKYFFEEAGALENLERFKLPLRGKELSSELPITDDEIRFIAWFLTDGGFPGRKRTIQISQAKPLGIKRIHELLDRLRYTYSEYYRINHKGFWKGNGIGKLTLFCIPKGVWKNKKGWIKLEKYLTKKYSNDLIGMSSRQFKIFWEELLWGDGNGDVRNKPQLTGSNLDILSGIQATAVMAGFATNTSWSDRGQYKKAWFLSVSEKDYLEIKINHPERKKTAITYSDKNQNCRVWCVQNKNETIIVRRNGKVAIIGNCIIMGRPTQSETLYVQSIGRGTRVKSDFFVKRYGTNKCIILDFVDNTGKHSLINAYELEKGKSLEDKMFIPEKTRQLLIDVREKRKREMEKLYGKDKIIDLLILPEVRPWDSAKMLEPATEKQIKWIRDLGIWQEDVEYTKAMASELISAQKAADWQIRWLAGMKYDITDGATLGQYQKAKWQYDQENKYSMETGIIYSKNGKTN